MFNFNFRRNNKRNSDKTNDPTTTAHGTGNDTGSKSSLPPNPPRIDTSSSAKNYPSGSRPPSIHDNDDGNDNKDDDKNNNSTDPSPNKSNPSNRQPSSSSPASPENPDTNYRPPSAPLSGYGGYYQHGPSRADAPSRSTYSEGYPSWLPRRPPPPAPASTFHSSVGTPAPFDRDYFLSDDNDNDMDIDHELELQMEMDMYAHDPTTAPLESSVRPSTFGGRKPTPRSVRIVNLQAPAVAQGLGVRAPPASASQSPVVKVDAGAYGYGYGGAHARTHSDSRWYGRKQPSGVAPPSTPGMRRAYGRAMGPPAVFNSVAGDFAGAGEPKRSRPRFNLRGLQLELLRSPSRWMKVYYRLWPVLVLGHLPLQTFLDFNTVYMILQVSKYPLPGASPNSGKNWALGAAAYIACWLVWILVIFIIYELVYSFARRWRVRRPLIFPLYLSSPGYTYAGLSSYSVFCFFQHLRYTAFVPLSPVGEGVSESSSSGASPRTSSESEGHTGMTTEQEKDNHKHRAAAARLRESEEGGIIEVARSDVQQHTRTDSESSAGSAKEEDPALGRHQRSQSQTKARPHHIRGRGILSRIQHALGKRGRRAGRVLRRVTWRDGLAETFNLYAQNLPNVVVLLPRAGLALALLLAFSPPPVGGTGALASSRRDATFFRTGDGLLTGYARGVLWANVAWTAWRVLVLIVSWVGLWALSGHSCGGICGPRDKWEEEEHNRLSAAFSVSSSVGTGDDDVLPWEWRECTRARVQDAWEFCLVGRLRWGLSAQGEKASRGVETEKAGGFGGRADEEKEGGEDEDGGLSDEGLKRVLAAVGFPSVPTPARRGVLTQDLFESPTKGKGSGAGGVEDANGSPRMKAELKLKELEPVVVAGGSKTKDGPLMQLPYPFTRPGSGQVSSRDLVPFPKEKGRESAKSSRKSGSKSSKSKSKSKSGSSSGSGSGSGSGSAEDDDEDQEGEGEGGDDAEEEDDDDEPYSEEPSTSTGEGGRASNSMSSLGHPLPPAAAAFGARSSPSMFSAAAQTTPISHSHSNSHSSSGLGSPISGRGSTRFPFLSGPAHPHSGGARRSMGPPGAHSVSSSTGHSRGLSQVSGFSGISGLSAGSGYAASGSAGPGLSEEGGGRDRNTSAESGSSGESQGAAGLGAGIIPMPPRHPRTRAGTVPGVVRPAIATTAAAVPTVAFPSVAGQEGRERRRRRVDSATPDVPLRVIDTELGLGVLSTAAESTRRRARSQRMGEGDGTSLQLSALYDDVDINVHGPPPQGEEEQEGEFDDEDDNEDDEARGEREDKVGLLSVSGPPSRRSSTVGLETQAAAGVSASTSNLSHRSRTRSRHSSSGKSRESLRVSVSAAPRSRPGSFTRQGYSVHTPTRQSRRESVASAVRERATSFGARVRERAQSLMQSVVAGVTPRETLAVPASPTSPTGRASMSMTNLSLSNGEYPHHQRLGSAGGDSVFGAASARVPLPEVVRVGNGHGGEHVAAAPAGMRSVSGQSGESQETAESGSSGSSGAHRMIASHHQHLIDEEAYYSSATSNSHSGSGSIASRGERENYTFGRPMPFLARSERERVLSSSSRRSAPRELAQPRVEEEDEDHEDIGVPALPHSPIIPPRAFTPPSPPQVRTRTASLARSTSSFGEEQFYSPHGTGSLANSGVATPVPAAHPESQPMQQEEQTETQLPSEIPWTQHAQSLLQPPQQRWVGGGPTARNRSLSPSSGNSGSGSGERLSSLAPSASSVMMLSSAAESFVTAPASLSGGTGSTISGGSSETATISGSWEERGPLSARGGGGPGGLVGLLFRGTAAAVTGGRESVGGIPVRGRRDSGMVDRVGDAEGAGTALGGGRVA